MAHWLVVLKMDSSLLHVAAGDPVSFILVECIQDGLITGLGRTLLHMHCRAAGLQGLVNCHPLRQRGLYCPASRIHQMGASAEYEMV